MTDQNGSQGNARPPTYERLAAPFDITFSDVRGGVSLTYITGEQVTSRLNEVLGPGGWSFSVLQHEIHAEADEAWVLGELVAIVDDQTVKRQQFGSQKLKRSRSTGAPLDIGFDLKGAATDSMKKCASLLGVGLYLSRRDPGRNGRPSQQPHNGQQQNRSQPSRSSSTGQVSPELLDKWSKVKAAAKDVGINVQDREPESEQQLCDWTQVLSGRVNEAKYHTAEA